MVSSSKSINTFELAIILAKASRVPEELASNISLTKLAGLINAHFAPTQEKANAGAANAEVHNAGMHPIVKA